jgi:hypothetical protein
MFKQSQTLSLAAADAISNNAIQTCTANVSDVKINVVGDKREGAGMPCTLSFDKVGCKLGCREGRKTMKGETEVFLALFFSPPPHLSFS